MDLSLAVKEHLSNQELDLRVSKNGRWMDQKVTPDVLTFIADAVLNIPPSKQNNGFTKNDIWFSEYFKKNMPMFFAKPDTENETAKSEYDKVAAQPLKMLAYSGLLSESKQGNENWYRVSKSDILQQVSLSAANAQLFISIYVDAVLNRSGFGPQLDKYLTSSHSKEDMGTLKEQFQKFTLANTNINNVVEINRIFPKVINPIAVRLGIPGITGGFVSKYSFNYSDLMYNRKNWRDLNKDKGKTRQEHSASFPSEKYKEYEMRKVMNAVKNRHYPNSELKDALGNDLATQVHHIFPKSKFPSIASKPENLILLTPQQHNTRAHPNNNTNLIDKNYQIDCLIAKIRTIESTDKSDIFYSETGMREVLLVGLGIEPRFEDSWDAIIAKLQSHRI